jgi:flagellar export protein FliJ
MKSFQFRLERVLRWREGQTHQAEQLLRQAVGEVQRLRAAADSIAKERTSLAEGARWRDPVRGFELAHLARYSEHLRCQEQAFRRELTDGVRRVEIERAGYNAAARRQKVLEALKTRQRRLWQTEEQRAWETIASESYLAQWASSGQRLI